MRVLQSLVLGLIGLTLILYTSLFSSPIQIYRIEPHIVHESLNSTIRLVNHTETNGGAGSSSIPGASSRIGAAALISVIASKSVKPLKHAASAKTTKANDTILPSNEGANSVADNTIKTASLKKRESTEKVPPKNNQNQKNLKAQKGVLTKDIYNAGHNIPNAEICPDLGKDMKLLVLITSSLDHGEMRMAIRQTWGHFGQRKDIGVAFVLGSSLSNEMNEAIATEMNMYGDIIQAKFIDVYDNLTLKTVSMFEWVDNYCSLVPFLLKTDDDMFINIPKLLSVTEKYKGAERTVFGRLAKKWKPIRKSSSKYYVSINLYPKTFFPDFTTGPAYLVSNDAIHDLYTNALNATYLKLEDVFMTGVVAQSIGIKRVHINEFYNKRIPYNVCNVRKAVSIHMVKYHEQFILWEKLHDTRVRCK